MLSPVSTTVLGARRTRSSSNMAHITPRWSTFTWLQTQCCALGDSWVIDPHMVWLILNAQLSPAAESAAPHSLTNQHHRPHYYCLIMCSLHFPPLYVAMSCSCILHHWATLFSWKRANHKQAMREVNAFPPLKLQNAQHRLLSHQWEEEGSILVL